MTNSPVQASGASRAARARAAVARLGRPSGRDVISGLVTGLFSIPEGMAYASIGGFNPVAGLYSGMLPTLAGSVFARTVLMVTTLTSAIALSSHSVLASAHLDPHRPANLAALVIVVAAVMAVMGLLRAGSVMNFVSNAVMTGFTTGIALQIIVGVLGDATRYKPAGSNTVGKLIDSLAHIGSWDGPTVAVAAATVAVWALFRLVRPVASLATLFALVIVTAAVKIFGVSVETVGDIASIPSRFPAPTVPAWSAIPHLLAGGFAVALVALAQAAGISAAVPNPDGSKASASGDFLAQGLANAAGGFFGALPAGGSLSRTGVAVSAGARTRWAGIFAGAWLIGVVVLFGDKAEIIPMPVIGGLVLVIGAELVAGRVPDIVLVARTSLLSAVAMVVTFAATTQFPLQDAIFLGAALSLLLYCVQAARQADLIALEPTGPGRWRTADVPASAPSGQVTVIFYNGVGLFAEVPRLDERWPDLSGTRDAVLIVSMRTLPDVPSSTVIKELEKRVRTLRANGSKLMIAGVTPQVARILDRSGLTQLIGKDNVIPATDELFGALDRAVNDARRWIADHSGDPASPGSAP
jgi:SulP family sulfate permease